TRSSESSSDRITLSPPVRRFGSAIASQQGNATMKRHAAKATRLLGVTALLPLVLASPRFAQTVPDTAKELIALEDEWRAARIKGDVALLERLYAKELRITGTNGSVIDRTTDINGFASGAIKPESIERSDMRISVYGDAAIVSGRDDVKGRYN